MTRDTSGVRGPNEARSTLDSLDHFVALLAPDGTLLEVNATALRAGGIIRADVIGRPLWEAPWWSHSSDTQRELGEAIAVAATGEVGRYDAAVMAENSSRSTTTVDLQLTPVHGDNGVVRYLVAEGIPLDDGREQRRRETTKITEGSWADLLAELNDARAQADALRMLASSLAASRTVDDVASAIVDSLPAAVGAVRSRVAIATPSGDALHLFQPRTDAPPATQDTTTNAGHRWVEVPLDDTTLLGAAVLGRRPIHAADPTAVARRFVADLEQYGLQSLAAHPVVLDDGTVRAAIELAWSMPTPELAAWTIEPAVALCGAALRRAWIGDESSRSAALLDMLLQRAPVGFAFIDRDFCFNVVNERLAETNGRSVADHAGLRLGSISPALAEQTLPILRRVFDEGISLTDVEISGATPAQPGIERTWEAGFYPVDVPGLGVIGAGVVMVEVTDQRREQQALRDLAKHERFIARRLQAGLLPTGIPTLDGYEISARYEAGTAGLRVGGDWYEVVEIRPGDFAVVVGDAVGHDLDAAIAMSQIRNALTGLGHAHRDPARVIERLDEYAGQTPEVFASTIFYARLDPATGELRYTLAGHHPPVLIRADGTHDWFDAQPGPPVGVASTRSTAICQLQPGDTLIAYTDGLIEHHFEPIETGRARLLDTLDRTGNSTSLDELVAALLAAVPHPDRPDDIVLLAVRRTADTDVIAHPTSLHSSSPRS